MKSKSWDDAILAEHRAHMREESARAAFDELVSSAIEMPEYETKPGWHGDIRDFSYDDPTSGERPFAFIVNRRDLLFYIRLAGLRRVSGGFSALKEQFSTASENSRGEWTVRVASKEDAERLNAFLFSRAAPSEAHADRIPDGITREDVLSALKRLDAGETHAFADSVKYDLVFGGQRYVDIGRHYRDRCS